MAARALLDKIGGNDPTRLKALRARFSAPVYPGETIETSIWRSEGDTFLFQAKVPGREVTVLANGTAEIASA
jgi:acyl dehydratase